MRVAFRALSKLSKTAPVRFLATQRLNWNEAIGADFPFLSHKHQHPPERANNGEPWTTWLILGGRGSGKTRAGAEWVRQLALSDPAARIALIGETEHEAREVMVEGVSGLLAVHRDFERPQWIPTRLRIEWSNGAVAQVFSADSPESLRGPQFSAAWCDELAKWRQAGSEWAMASPLLAGAPFVLLDQNIVTLASGLDALERELQVRVVAANRDYGDATTLAIEATPQATALRPLTPVHIKAVRGGSGVTFSWIRRTRIDGDSWVGEVPLGEDSEAYTLDILSGTSVVRTLNATTPSALYAAADEIADFGSAQTSLSVQVTQLSATVGAGFKAKAVLIP